MAFFVLTMTLEHLKYAFYGFCAGLVVALVVWILTWWRSRALRTEVKQLQKHLHRQMEITHEGTESREKQLQSLKSQNENLRISLKTLDQKAGRHELRQLQVYDSAIRKLLAQTPGFSLAWEAALRESEKEHEEVATGLLAFAKKLVLPGGSSSRSHPHTASEDDEET